MNRNLTFEQAAVLAAVLLAVALVLRAVRRRRTVAAGAFLTEASLVVAMYAAWQLSGRLARTRTGGAYGRGEQILAWQGRLGLPSELTVQEWLLPHPQLVQGANLYYAVMHFPAMIALLAWLYLRHRDRYGPVRNLVAVSTAAAFVVSLVPVAPPRLLPGAGFVDTAREYGQSVYSSMAVAGPNQLAAMPSVHVGWSVIVGVVVVLVGVGPWRWLALAHPVLTVLVVAGTANHYWLDGVAAVAIIGAVAAAGRAGGRLLRRRTAPAADPACAVTGRAIGAEVQAAHTAGAGAETAPAAPVPVGQSAAASSSAASSGSTQS